MLMRRSGRNYFRQTKHWRKAAERSSPTNELVREHSELRNFKVTFVKLVHDRLAMEQHTLASARAVADNFKAEAESLRDEGGKSRAHLSQMTDELTYARTRIQSLTQ